MKLIDVNETRARIGGLSRNKLNTMIARGEFVEPLQVAGKLMFSEEEVDAWLSRQPRGLFPQNEGLKRYQESRKGQGAKSDA